MTPINDLERILANPKLGPESHPELFRLLRDAVLVFLMPYHPEVMGTISLKNGDPGPRFSMWKGADGIGIPIFSSLERANEACKKIGARDKQYALAEMKGQQLFAVLACQNYPIMINPACSTGTTYFDLNAVKKLANGSILKPFGGNAEENGQVTIVGPADYPTDFLQSLFQFLRQRSEVKAAWLFRQSGVPAGTKTKYVFVLKAVGDAESAKQDFGVVAHSACPRDAEYGVTLLDPTNAPLVEITSKASPFYAAPDYKAPDPTKGM